jgi:transposase-like protein
MKDVLLDNSAAFSFLESRRWNKGQMCPHCGVQGRFRSVHRTADMMNAYKCYACRGFFTLRAGTLLEGSHLPFDTWLAATYLIVASKGAVTVLCLSEILGITFQTATKLRRTLAILVNDDIPDRWQELSEAVAMARRGETSAAMGACPGPSLSPQSPRQVRQKRLAELADALSSPAVDRAFEIAVDRLLHPDSSRCACRSNSSARDSQVALSAESADNAPTSANPAFMQRNSTD